MVEMGFLILSYINIFIIVCKFLLSDNLAAVEEGSNLGKNKISL